MNLANLSAFGSSIVPGMVQGETRAAEATSAQEAAKRSQMQTQQFAADIASDVTYANSLAALGQAYGVAPSNAPQPPPPGQASPPAQPAFAPQPGQAPEAAPGQAMPGPQAPPPQQGQAVAPGPTTSSGQPAVPPNVPLPPQAQMLQQANGSAQAAPPIAPAPPRPQSQGAPQGSSPGPALGLQPQQLAQAAKSRVNQAEAVSAQAQGQAQGTMSAAQLAQLVMKANPGIQQRPELFVRTMERMQKFLSADGKNEFAQQKVSLEYDAKIQKIQADGAAKERTAQTQVEIAQIRAETAQQVAAIATSRAETVAQIAAASRQNVAATNVAGRSAEDDKKLRATYVKQAGQLGLKIDPTWSTDEIGQHLGEAEQDKEQRTQQRKTALETQKQQGRIDIEKTKEQARKDLEAGKTPDPKDLDALIDARSHGDTSVMNLPWGAQVKLTIMSKAAQRAVDRGTTIYAEDAKYHGTMAEATLVGRTAAQPAIGAAEIAQTLPLAMDASKKLNLRRFPTVNSLLLAEKYYAGKPDQQAAVAQLRQYVQSIRNAYQLIMARGGRQTVFNAKQAEELVNGNMPLSTLLAVGKAMEKEAAVVESATGQAMREVTGAPSETPSPTDKGGTTQLYFDAEGNQIPAPK